MKSFRAGFTLLETLLYSAMVAATIGLVLVGVYNVIESRYHSLARTEMEEEANFLMRKIAWVLSGASAINEPAVGATSTVLAVTKSNFYLNPVIIGKASSSVVISYGGGETIPLSSQSITVRELVFERVGSTAAPGIKVTLTVEFIPRFQLVIYNATSSVTTTIYVRQQ